MQYDLSARNLNLGPQYRALAVIAKGGMGAVYLGEMRNENGERHTVAIKVMHQHISESAETIAMFVDEARVGTRVIHPNVVRVLATEVVEETPFLVMEYVEGLSWSRLMRCAEKAGRPIPPSISARVVRDTLLGMHAAHELRTPTGEDAQVVHRDISPQNILVGSDGVVRLTDFGVATFAGRITSTAPGELRGKLGYMAPEQLQKGGADRRSDVFAAGIVLWEALTAKRLFGADSQAETLAKVLSEPIPPPSTYRHEVAFELDDVCVRALERAKDRRFQTALEFANELEKAVEIANDEELVAFLNELAAENLAQQRAVRADALRNAGRWSSPDIVIAPPRPKPAFEAEAEASVPKTYAGTVPPQASPPWIRVALIGGGAGILVIVGTLIGRVSSSSPSTAPPVPATEPPTMATPAPVDPTPPPSATVIAASPDPIEVAPPTASVSTAAPSTSMTRRPSTKPHKPTAPAASPPAKPGDTRKYVPGEL